MDGALDAVSDAAGTVLERLQLDDERSLVRSLTCNEVITNDSVAVEDGRVVGQHLVDFCHNLLGALL